MSKEIKSFTCRPENIADIRRYKCDTCLNCKWFSPNSWVNYQSATRYDCRIGFYINKKRFSTVCYINDPGLHSCGYWREK